MGSESVSRAFRLRCASQINSNWVYELPVGHGERWGSAMGRLSEALLGGWQFSGLLRWTSGYPYSIGNGFFFPTNWDLEGAAVLTGKVPESGTFRDSFGNPNIFKDMNAALASFRFAYPGESGNRNVVRGAGFFGINTGVSKTWRLAESQSLRFSWEAFNITNSVVSTFLTEVGYLRSEPRARLANTTRH